MFKRARIIIAVEVDLDAVPGWGHEATDWVNLIVEPINRQSHYNTSCEVLSIEERAKIFIDGKGWTSPIFSDHPDFLMEA